MKNTKPKKQHSIPQHIIQHNLKTTRLVKGLTQIDLAAKLGVDKNTVGHWESGYAFPSLDMLVKICDALDVQSIDDFCRKKAKVAFCKPA